jgi:hypothetical protein
MAPDAAATSATETPKPPETLSQFITRVLAQLSLSAWLPSAALVLLLDLIAQLGTVLDAKYAPRNPAAALGATFTRMAQVSVGGTVLLIIAIVVLTMLTQAFSFEAIQALEGYWGTWAPVEWLARHRANWHRRSVSKLDTRARQLTTKAWRAAKPELAARSAFTPDMIARKENLVLGTVPTVMITDEQQRRVRFYDWTQHAPSDLLRQRVNVDRRRRDYPDESRILPTRLGNILRRYEDQTSVEQLQSFVQRVFDDLPPALQAEHDEQRTRLDLYCSMVFVLAATGLIAVARFAPQHWPYVAGSAATTILGMFVMYRAALATARAYGGLLLTIAALARQAR